MRFTLILFLVFIGIKIYAQQDSSGIRSFSLAGYVTEMPWMTFYRQDLPDEFTNLIHNRLNFKWDINKLMTARLEIRNRIYSGDQVKNNPSFADDLSKNQNTDLSVTWFSNESTVFHSNLERLFLEYRPLKWNIRLGRQRINWGMANTWNPNDIFNFYNILDFDYEERAGNDAIRAKYMLGDLSSIEGVMSIEKDQSRAAVKYATNLNKYDLQFIGGLVKKGFTTGFGWAGNISDIGFRGECEYYLFNPDSVNDLNFTVELDYAFKDGLYTGAGLLYNGNGLNESLNPNLLFSFEPSPLNLMPAKWNMILISSKELSALFTTNLNIIYSPVVNSLIIYPAIKYNFKNNIDVDLIWQAYFAEYDNLEMVTNSTFLRIKLSF